MIFPVPSYCLFNESISVQSWKNVSVSKRKQRKTKGFEFVWITGSTGRNQARTQLEEAYNITPSVYNLKRLYN